MIFFDFEVFKYDWIVTFINTDPWEITTIENDREELEKFYEKQKNNLFAGFNSRNYDVYIMQGILADFDPKKINDFIIEEGQRGYKFSSLLRKFPIFNYDVMGNIDRGLKVFEGFMGHSIKETSVPFDIDRKLTKKELAETIAYNIHDVMETMEVFLRRKSDFDAHIALIKMFNLPAAFISKTKVGLSAEILEAKKIQNINEDMFDISFPDTLRLKKYKFVKEWYEDWSNRDYSKSLEVDIAGVPHKFAWGGVHGALLKYADEGYFVMMDVASLYPTLMLVYGLLSRACNPEKFHYIVEKRLELKKAKDPMQAPLKIVINGTYGAMKDPTNPLYDPRQANNVCVYGQLLILDLIEHLEDYCDIIQSNTDGVLVKMRAKNDKEANEQWEIIDDIAYEWEERTGLMLEFDEYRRVYQKDVNNYIIIDAEGHYKSKGAYVKKLNDLDYDLPIVNKAVVNYIVDGVPVEDTINNCDELREFQQVKKISSKYKYITHGGDVLNERCVRCFASKHRSDGGLMKLHATTGRFAKMEGTPEHCFIDNDDITEKTVPFKLDRQWYIDVANKRLRDFGL